MVAAADFLGCHNIKVAISCGLKGDPNTKKRDNPIIAIGGTLLGSLVRVHHLLG